MGSEEHRIGGKAHALSRVRQLGIPVPRFITLLPHDMLRLLHADLDALLSLPLPEAGRRLAELRQRIASDDGKVMALAASALQRLEGFPQQLILRSSAVGEDGVEHSFAGIFASERAQRDAASIASALRVIIEGWCSDRVLFYLDSKRISRWPALCVMVQEYIPADAGGVAFSSHVRQGRDGVLIESSAQPQDVVEGRQCTSTFIIGESIETISGKPLRPEHAMAVAQTVRRIADAFGKPQDVEWLIDGGKVIVLQSRPITASRSDMRIWDNSNIAESYSGIVLPLTASFCREVYRTVYIDVARTSGVPAQRIREHDEVFSHLLGFLKGRIYYNMLNWYTMLTLFPGYGRNKSNLDRMISARSKANLDAQHRDNMSFPFKVKYYALNTYRYTRFDRDLRRFHADMREEFNRFAKLPVERMAVHDLLKLYYGLKRDVLSRWSITVDNDFLLMTFFGMLRKRLPQEEILALISDVGAISAAQVHALHALAGEFHKHPELVDPAIPAAECYRMIQDRPAYAALRDHMAAYLERYEGRFGSELKLEVSVAPWHIVEEMRIYAARKPHRTHHRAASGRSIMVRYLVAKVKHHASRREESRLLRAQAFGCARRIFTSIGARLAEAQVLDAPQDIFYLQTEEIERYIEGSSPTAALRETVELRKQEYARYAHEGIEGVLSTQGIPSLSLRSAGKRSGALAGNGCSPGRITGRARILTTCDITKISPGDILVTSHTDPGWTPLIGLCAGVIVEHGGVLSHAAIISRELGIPCVVGAHDATAILKDGQEVTIDGGSGEIIV